MLSISLGFILLVALIYLKYATTNDCEMSQSFCYHCDNDRKS